MGPHRLQSLLWEWCLGCGTVRGRKRTNCSIRELFFGLFLKQCLRIGPRLEEQEVVMLVHVIPFPRGVACDVGASMLLARLVELLYYVLSLRGDLRSLILHQGGLRRRGRCGRLFMKWTVGAKTDQLNSTVLQNNKILYSATRNTSSVPQQKIPLHYPTIVKLECKLQ